jgi:hypothetical protein
MILPGETHEADEVFTHLTYCDALLGSSIRHTEYGEHSLCYPACKDEFIDNHDMSFLYITEKNLHNMIQYTVLPRIC